LLFLARAVVEAGGALFSGPACGPDCAGSILAARTKNNPKTNIYQ
jgi:hypothetical protein